VIGSFWPTLPLGQHYPLANITPGPTLPLGQHYPLANITLGVEKPISLEKARRGRLDLQYQYNTGVFFVPGNAIYQKSARRVPVRTGMTEPNFGT
jgi:hypothetical protein